MMLEKRSNLLSSGLLSIMGISCLLLSALPADAQPSVVHQLGVLVSSDEQLSTGSYFDSYGIEGSEGQRVSISLDSSDFDTFLGLFDSDGNLVATNDDAASDNPNSYISTTLPRNDTYTIVATSYRPQSGGDYRMSIRNFSPPTVTRTASSQGSWDGLNALFSIPFVQDIALDSIASMFSFGGSASSSSDSNYYPPQTTTPSQPPRGMSYPAGSGIHGGGPQHGTRNAW